MHSAGETGGQRVALRQGVVGQGRDSVSWLHADHLGSVSEVTSATGGRIAQERYYPYGRVRWGSAPTSYNFTGQRLDPSTGLLFYGARYYDPRIARFVQADTLVPSINNPQMLNRYSYVVNNPLRYTDPTGHVFMADYATTLYPNTWLIGFSEPPPPEEDLTVQAMIMDFMPVFGDFKGLVEVFEGKDAITGEELGPERFLGLLFLSELRNLRHTDEIVGEAGMVWKQLSLPGFARRTAYEIGEEGEDLVFRYLNDPTLQREVPIFAPNDPIPFARLDGLTSTAIHEVKNRETLSLSEEFKN